MASKLVEKVCTPCRGGIPPLTREQADVYHSEAPDWELLDDESVVFYGLLPLFSAIRDNSHCRPGLYRRSLICAPAIIAPNVAAGRRIAARRRSVADRRTWS
jgi:hypothetical protein